MHLRLRVESESAGCVQRLISPLTLRPQLLLNQLAIRHLLLEPLQTTQQLIMLPFMLYHQPQLLYFLPHNKQNLPFNNFLQLVIPVVIVEALLEVLDHRVVVLLALNQVPELLVLLLLFI